MYVCGDWFDANTQVQTWFFTVVRFKAAGNDASNGPTYWVYSHAPLDTKENRATALVVGRDGDVYVTGWAAEVTHGPTDYVTVKIKKDPTSLGEADQAWLTTYDNGGEDKALAIALTHQVVSGVMKQFVHVTGMSEGSGTGFDIATLRYSDDGTGATSMYSARRHNGSANSEDIGFAIIGAGRNAYVVGKSTRTTTGADYVLLGYDDAGTSRFSAYYYNNSSQNGTDVGLAGTMGGAGALLATGYSAGGSTAEDFLSLLHNESVDTRRPDSYTAIGCTYVSGSLSDLLAEGGGYMTFQSASSGLLGQKITVEFTGTYSSGISNPSELSLNLVCYTGTAGLTQVVQIYDYVDGEWKNIDVRPSTSSASKLVLVLKDDPLRYLAQSLAPDTSTLKVRIVWTSSGASATFYGYLDQLAWDVLGS